MHDKSIIPLKALAFVRKPSGLISWTNPKGPEGSRVDPHPNKPVALEYAWPQSVRWLSLKKWTRDLNRKLEVRSWTCWNLLNLLASHRTKLWSLPGHRSALILDRCSGELLTQKLEQKTAQKNSRQQKHLDSSHSAPHSGVLLHFYGAAAHLCQSWT